MAAYTVLARRYRSGTFDEVVGQSHVGRTLRQAITSGRVAHAYLFCGTRGVGKTSMARILAKALNCRNADGPTPDPCGECESCLAIARGEDIDVIEIDAASNTGVDDVRQVIENSRFRPMYGRFKVYIIDEVHMLSRNAFNALLKTLEEPPGHVKFILATTEPEKIPATILSRCQRYDFRNIPTREIAEHLRFVVTREGVEAEEGALRLVARAGAGSMRDALSLLDRLLSVGESPLSADAVEALLGVAPSRAVFRLVDAIIAADASGVLREADATLASGVTPEALVTTLTEHLRDVMVLAACAGPGDPADAGEGGGDGLGDLVERPDADLAEMLRQARSLDLPTLSQDIAILDELRRSLRTSGVGRAMLDATLVRLALAARFDDVARVLAGMDGQRPASHPETSASRPATSASRPASTVASTPAPSAEKKTADLVAEPAEPVPDVTGIVVDPPAGLPDPAAVWIDVLATLAGDAPLSAMLAVARIAGIEPTDDGYAAIVRFPHGSPMAARLGANGHASGKTAKVIDALTRRLGRPASLRIELDPPPQTVQPAPALSRTPVGDGTAVTSADCPPKDAAVSDGVDVSNDPAVPPRPPSRADLAEYERQPLAAAVIELLDARLVRVDPPAGDASSD